MYRALCNILNYLNAMKTLFAVILICLFVQPVPARTVLTERVPVKEGQTLKMNLPTGATVNISTWQEATVEASLQVLECTGGDCEISLKGTARGAEIHSAFRSARRAHMTSTDIRIDVMVPEKFNVEITSSGGSVSVSGLQGSLQGSTAGGGLNLSGLDGQVRFSTAGGSVEVMNCTLEATISSAGGSIKISDSSIDGGINTGGGSVLVSNTTLNGGTNTGGGSITAEDIRGHYYAATGAGNVTVSLSKATAMEELELRLGTGAGKVSLMLPKGMDPEISVELAYTNNREACDILSDFDLDIEKTTEWDDSKGTPRKYVYGKSLSGSPMQSIRIKNTNGDVEIRRY